MAYLQSQTAVYHLQGGKFRRVGDPAKLSLPTRHQVRNQYINPIRWIKPGVLQLRQDRVLSDESGADFDPPMRFTVQFDGKGKFKIIAKERAPEEQKE